MDFKAKFSKNRLTEGLTNRMPQAGNRPATDKQIANLLSPLSNAFNSSISNPSSKPFLKQASSLNKYKKEKKEASMGEAPVGQFKNYLLEAKNVFYQERPELKQLQNLKAAKFYLIMIWALFALAYFLISRIKPYQGICPQKATCGVYVHCPELFEFDEDDKKCLISKDFLDEVQERARQKVKNLQYNFGSNQCEGIQTIPSLNIKDLFNELEDSRKIQMTRNAARLYFQNPENQKNEGFQLINYNQVVPTQKRYSLTCSISLFITSKLSFSTIFYILAFASLSIFIGMKIHHSRRYSVMYKYLKNRVFEAPERTLNITHTMAELQSLFGSIDEEAWRKINDERTSDKAISFYEDDFLFWKAA